MADEWSKSSDLTLRLKFPNLDVGTGFKDTCPSNLSPSNREENGELKIFKPKGVL